MKSSKTAVPTKRFDRKGPLNEMNSKVVKSILKKGEAPRKSKKEVSEKLNVARGEKRVTFQPEGRERKVKKKAPTEDDVETSLKMAAMEKMNEKGGKANKQQQLVKGKVPKTHEKEQEKEKQKGKEKEKQKAKEKEKEKDMAKTKEVAVAKGKKPIDYGKKNSRPVNYFPCKKRHVEEMFKTPPLKNRGSGSSIASSVPSKVKDMQNMLEDSEGDEDEEEKSENETEEEKSGSEGEESIQESEDDQDCDDDDDEEEQQDDDEADDSEADQEEAAEDEEECESEDEESEDQEQENAEVPEGNGESLALVTQTTEKDAAKFRNSCLAGVGIFWTILSYVFGLFEVGVSKPLYYTVSVFPNLRRNTQERVGQLRSLKGKVPGSRLLPVSQAGIV